MRIFYINDSSPRKKKSGERYFVLGGFGIDGDQVHKLKKLQQELFASVIGLGAKGDELKFSSIGKHKHTLALPNPFAREQIPMSDRILLIQNALDKLGKIPSVEAIVAVVDKKHAFGAEPIEHAFRVLMERIQGSSSERSRHTLIFSDEERTAKEHLRSLHETNASQYVTFVNIIETISFVPSHLSPGVQFADLVAGSTSRMLNFGD